MPVGMGDDLLVQELEDGLPEFGIRLEFLEALKHGRNVVPAVELHLDVGDGGLTKLLLPALQLSHVFLSSMMSALFAVRRRLRRTGRNGKVPVSRSSLPFDGDSSWRSPAYFLDSPNEFGRNWPILSHNGPNWLIKPALRKYGIIIQYKRVI